MSQFENSLNENTSKNNLTNVLSGLISLDEKIIEKTRFHESSLSKYIKIVGKLPNPSKEVLNIVYLLIKDDKIVDNYQNKIFYHCVKYSNNEYKWEIIGNSNDYLNAINDKLNLKANVDFVNIELNKKADKEYVNQQFNLYIDENNKNIDKQFAEKLDNKVDKNDIKQQLDLKANNDDVNKQLNIKVDKSELSTSLTEINDNLNLKANIADVETQLNLKANIADVETQLNLKATKEELSGKANQSYVDAQLNLKATKEELSGKVDQSYVDAQLNLKATKEELSGKVDQSYVINELSKKVNTTDAKNLFSTFATKTELSKKIDRQEFGEFLDLTKKLDEKADKNDVVNDLKEKAAKSYVDENLNLKVNKTELLADLNKINANLNLKANKSELSTSLTEINDNLNLKANIADVNEQLTNKASISYIAEQLDNLLENSSNLDKNKYFKDELNKKFDKPTNENDDIIEGSVLTKTKNGSLWKSITTAIEINGIQHVGIEIINEDIDINNLTNKDAGRVFQWGGNDITSTFNNNLIYRKGNIYKIVSHKIKYPQKLIINTPINFEDSKYSIYKDIINKSYEVYKNQEKIDGYKKSIDNLKYIYIKEYNDEILIQQADVDLVNVDWTLIGKKQSSDNIEYVNIIDKLNNLSWFKKNVKKSMSSDESESIVFKKDDLKFESSGDINFSIDKENIITFNPQIKISDIGDLDLNNLVLDGKADRSYVDEQLSGKADKKVETILTNYKVELDAEIEKININKANSSWVEQELNKKANSSDLSKKADVTFVKSYVKEQLGGSSNPAPDEGGSGGDILDNDFIKAQLDLKADKAELNEINETITNSLVNIVKFKGIKNSIDELMLDDETIGSLYIIKNEAIDGKNTYNEYVCIEKDGKKSFELLGSFDSEIFDKLNQDITKKQDIISNKNKLDYSLLSGQPTSLSSFTNEPNYQTLKDVNNLISGKADQSYVNKQLDLKANKEDVVTIDKLSGKADQSYVDTQLALKADKLKILTILKPINGNHLIIKYSKLNGSLLTSTELINTKTNESSRKNVKVLINTGIDILWENCPEKGFNESHDDLPISVEIDNSIEQPCILYYCWISSNDVKSDWTSIIFPSVINTSMSELNNKLGNISNILDEINGEVI